MVTYIYTQPSSSLTVGGKTYKTGDDCTDMGAENLEKYARYVTKFGEPDAPEAPKAKRPRMSDGTTE